jgi:glutathione S-transferase
MEIDTLMPVMQVFVNTHEMWEDRREQVPQWADVCKAQIADRYQWLNDSLTDGRDYIAGPRYTMADITAQSAVLMARAVCGIPVSDAQTNLGTWWKRVSGQPTAST